MRYIIIIGLFVFAFLLSGCDLFNGNTSKIPEVIWTYDISSPYESKIQPAIDNNLVFIASESRIRSFNLSDGEVIWESSMLADGDIDSRRLLQDKLRLYVNDHNRVYSIAKEDGSILWEKQYAGFEALGPDIMSQSEKYLFLPGKGEVLKISKVNGLLEQRIRLNHLLPANASSQTANTTFVSDDGYLYVTTGYFGEGATATGGNIFAFDIATGGYEWGYAIPPMKELLEGAQDSVFTNRASDGGDINGNRIVVTGGRSVYSLDRFTGKVVWETTIAEAGKLGYMLKTDKGRAFVGDSIGWLYAFDTVTGALDWKIDVGGFFATFMTIIDNRLYLCSTGGGEIWVINTETGEAIWHGYPPMHKKNSFHTYISSVAVSEEYIVNVGGFGIYALNNF